MERRADEILILRRFSGYLRLHIPALIYSAKAGYLLEKQLLAREGVRKVSLKKEVGKVSVYYDAVMTPESEILLLIDKVATPLLQHDQQKSYEKIIRQVDVARKRRLVQKALVAVILGYLLKIHWKLLTQRWLKNPLRYWPELLAIGALIYIHRKQIRAVPELG